MHPFVKINVTVIINATEAAVIQENTILTKEGWRKVGAVIMKSGKEYESNLSFQELESLIIKALPPPSSDDPVRIKL